MLGYVKMHLFKLRQCNSVSSSLCTLLFSGPFPCDICGRQFNDTGNLKRHIECTHGGKRKWTCFICGKSVRERYDIVELITTSI